MCIDPKPNHQLSNMKITSEQLFDLNQSLQPTHQRQWNFLAETLTQQGIDTEALLTQLIDFQVAIPSWALGTGGTRFGRFAGGGEPRSLEEKIDDVGLMHALNQSSGAISLHIPWDIPSDPAAIRERMEQHGLRFDAMNSNTFQDQPGQPLSYKHGSLGHANPAVRQQAVEHNQEVIRIGESLGSQALTVWLADGANFPGQRSFRRALENTQASLEEIYSSLPGKWKLLIEYKPFEPNFYSTVIPDWGTSFLLANQLGSKAFTLVDLGHHLPNTNIEQIVATLLMREKLGGFHFNDSKYADDDLTVGAIRPYQLFLIFLELIDGFPGQSLAHSPLSFMIDASHNTKDPLEDLLQSVEAMLIAYAQALLVDSATLEEARFTNDAALAQNVLQNAYRTDVRPLLREARLRSGAAIQPLLAYRSLEIRQRLIHDRGRGVATGL